MSTAIFVRNGAAVSRKSLCYTCRRAHIQIGYADSEEEVRCGFFYDRPRLVSFAVRECTSFLDKLTASLDEMEDIAFVIDLKKGNPLAGFGGAAFKVTKPETDEDDE